MLLKALVVLCTLLSLGSSTRSKNKTSAGLSTSSASCFPALGFQMPSTVPSSLTGWWCDMATEYGFVGFSYEITACQSPSQLNQEFADIRNTFNGRYIRLYGFCDNPGYYDTVVDAAWNNGLGVLALIWFGFDGSNLWQTRRDMLFLSLHTNPKAKFITRGLQFGSEPLFDHVLSPSALAAQVRQAQTALQDLAIPVTISDLAYGYESNGDAPQVFSAIDFIAAHMLPYFYWDASTGGAAWPDVANDLNYFVSHGNGKKIYLTENGWPSTHYPGVEPNSPNAVSDIPNEEAYYQLLDSQCTTFKNYLGGSVGWFWHIYSDNQEPGYGIYDSNGNLKFTFQPKTSC